MNLLQISYFLALAKEKSFKKTAENLYISQPAVSMQISALEKEWGLKLFSRNYKEVELTPAGEIMFRMFDRAFNEYDIALERAKTITDNPKTILKIGVPEYFNFQNLTDILSDYQTEHPNVMIHIESAPLSHLVFEHGKSSYFDLVINHEFLVDKTDNVNTMLFAHRKHAFIISKSHPICRNGNTPILKDFAGETVFNVSEREDISNAEYIRFICKSQGFTPRQIYALPNANSAMLSAKLCQGVALLDDLIALPSDYGLMMIPTDVQLNWLLVWSKETVSPQTADLAAYIQSNITFSDN